MTQNMGTADRLIRISLALLHRKDWRHASLAPRDPGGRLRAHELRGMVPGVPGFRVLHAEAAGEAFVSGVMPTGRRSG